VRRQAKRDAAFDKSLRVYELKRFLITESKAASRFACHRTPKNVSNRTLALPAPWLSADNSDRDADLMCGLVSPSPTRPETSCRRVVDRLHLSDRDARPATPRRPRTARLIPGGSRNFRAGRRMRFVLVGIRHERRVGQGSNVARLRCHHHCEPCFLRNW